MAHHVCNCFVMRRLTGSCRQAQRITQIDSPTMVGDEDVTNEPDEGRVTTPILAMTPFVSDATLALSSLLRGEDHAEVPVAGPPQSFSHPDLVDETLTDYQQGFQDGLMSPLVRLQSLATGVAADDVALWFTPEGVERRVMRDFTRMVHDRLNEMKNSASREHSSDKTIFMEGFATGVLQYHDFLKTARLNAKEPIASQAAKGEGKGKKGYEGDPY